MCMPFHFLFSSFAANLNDERTIKMKLKPDPTVFLFRYRFLDEATSMLKSWSLSLVLSLWTLAIYQFDFKGLKDLNRLHIQCQPFNNKNVSYRIVS